jgi:DNA mismatch endonuclease (patch repair protein)
MDRLTPAARSRNMSRVKGANTSPELTVRRLLHRMGFRFRLHSRRLPGTPDIVLRKHRTVIFVNGCFWHRHSGCRRASVPATNIERWRNKFARTVQRDAEALASLQSAGWRSLVVWECELRDLEALERRLSSYFNVQVERKIVTST